MITLKDEILAEVAKRLEKETEIVEEVMDISFQYMKKELILKNDNIFFINLGRLGYLLNSYDLNKQAIYKTSSFRRQNLKDRVDYMEQFQDYSRVFAVPLVYVVSWYMLKETTFSKLYVSYYDIIEKLSYNQNEKVSKYFKSNS